MEIVVQISEDIYHKGSVEECAAWVVRNISRGMGGSADERLVAQTVRTASLDCPAEVSSTLTYIRGSRAGSPIATYRFSVVRRSATVLCTWERMCPFHAAEGSRRAGEAETTYRAGSGRFLPAKAAAIMAQGARRYAYERYKESVLRGYEASTCGEVV